MPLIPKSKKATPWLTLGDLGGTTSRRRLDLFGM